VECAPKCDGKECGDDGCGGKCGACGKNEKCVGAQCLLPTCQGSCGGQSPFDCYCDKACLEYDDCCDDVCEACPEICGEPPKDKCNGIGWVGCCEGNILKYCEGDSVVVTECGDEGNCGWKPSQNYYDCGTDGKADPSGENPMKCSVICKPSCEGVECGSDGCGGSCGTCNTGSVCTPDGLCCSSKCQDKECGLDGCGGTCGTCGEGLSCDFWTCVEGIPGGCAITGAPGCGGCGCESCVALVDEFCVEVQWDAICVGLCLDCGTTCPCIPDCVGKACGDDGCDGSCGECPVYQTCVQGACELDDCEGILWEGCCDGDTLKYCQEGALVTEDCSGKLSCGWEAENSYYNCETGGKGDPSGEFPISCDDYCQPQCVDKKCGDDGCGSTCGKCAADELCWNGECALDECGDMTYEGCCDGHYLKWCEAGQIDEKDCQGKGPCGWSESAGYYNCGTDGGEDPAGTFPKWCPGACIPDCDGRECGNDGCDGECGTCEMEQVCSPDGKCVLPLPEPDPPDVAEQDEELSATPDAGTDTTAGKPPTARGGSGCAATGTPGGPGAALLMLLLALALLLIRRPSRLASWLRSACFVALLLLPGCSAGKSTADTAGSADTADVRMTDNPAVSDLVPDVILQDGADLHADAVSDTAGNEVSTDSLDVSPDTTADLLDVVEVDTSPPRRSTATISPKVRSNWRRSRER